MNKKELEAFAKEAAKSFKTEKDLSDFSRMLKTVTVEAALNTELDAHLGYDKHQRHTSNHSRNGYSDKTLYPDNGTLDIECRVIVIAHSNLSSLKNNKPALPVWMRRFSSSTLRCISHDLI